jgi:hypothetical protein
MSSGTATPVIQPYKFVGAYLDEETGLYKMGPGTTIPTSANSPSQTRWASTPSTRYWDPTTTQRRTRSWAE